jgi:hypothetical protein
MEQRADNAGVTPRQADDTTTRPLGSEPTRQSDARDSEPTHAPAGYGFADRAEERSHRSIEDQREDVKEHSSTPFFYISVAAQVSS